MLNVGKNFSFCLYVELLFFLSDVFLLENLHSIDLICLDMLDQYYFGIGTFANDTQQCKILYSHAHFNYN
jgi:hypothetical protein